MTDNPLDIIIRRTHSEMRKAREDYYKVARPPKGTQGKDTRYCNKCGGIFPLAEMDIPDWHKRKRYVCFKCILEHDIKRSSK